MEQWPVDASLAEVARQRDLDRSEETTGADDGVQDDRLRLVFTCCHPALSADAQVALTLREVCGLTTEEIAHVFLLGAPTVAQRDGYSASSGATVTRHDFRQKRSGLAD